MSPVTATPVPVNAATAMPSTGTTSITLRREIAATAHELFDALLDPEMLSEIMRPGSKSRATVSTDARVGGTFSIEMYRDDNTYPHAGTYLTIDRPHVLEFTWISLATKGMSSKVRIEFHVLNTDVKKPRTEVVLRHDQLFDEAAAKGHTEGWTDILVIMDGLFAKQG